MMRHTDGWSASFRCEPRRVQIHTPRLQMSGTDINMSLKTA